MNPKLAALFTEYAESHRHPTNQLTHKIAIPLIVFHILAMLDWVRLVTLSTGLFNGITITAAYVALALASIWYLRMSPKIGIVMILGSCLAIAVGRMMPWPVVVAIAAAGWLTQLAGHVVWEKKQPSFLRNLVHALVGPAFFIAKLLGDWPLKAEAAPQAKAA